MRLPAEPPSPESRAGRGRPGPDLRQAQSGKRVVIVPPAARVERRTAPPPRSGSRPVAGTGKAPDNPSPITGIRSVYLALAICLLLSAILDARGLLHSARGMADGPERSVALAAGNLALWVGSPLHATWPWEQFAALHGYHEQSGPSPLLAGSAAAPSPTPPAAPAPVTGRPAAAPTAVHAAAKKPKRHAAAGPPWPRITRTRPLRLLITGDSLTEYMGPDIVQDTASWPVRGFVETHYGTGLVRPDFVDWSLVATQQVAKYHPDAVVIMLGGNDFQNMTMPDGHILIAGTPAWDREYQRRAAVVIHIWTRGGAHVFWLSIPPARDATWAHIDALMNAAVSRAAAATPGARFVNVLGPVTNHGQYADFVNHGGATVLVREPDGVHLNAAGSEIVAQEVEPMLRRVFRLR